MFDSEIDLDVISKQFLHSLGPKRSFCNGESTGGLTLFKAEAEGLTADGVTRTLLDAALAPVSLLA